MCSTAASKCDANKEKNSAGLKEAYESSSRPISDFGGKQNWKRGLTVSDPRVQNNVDAQRGKTKNFRKPMSEEGRNNISEGRTKVILAGRYDSSGRKGHRGHYDGVYFHSSWELAYYVYTKETTNKHIARNMSAVLEYEYAGRVRRYIPDFVVDGALVEIKGYLHGDRDSAKFEQTKNNVIYKFANDLQNELGYCRTKYGAEFWKVLYG